MVQLTKPQARGTILKTIFRADLEDAAVLSLVEYADGHLDVLRNGIALYGGPWPADELTDCIDTFQRIYHQSRRPVLRKR